MKQKLIELVQNNTGILVKIDPTYVRTALGFFHYVCVNACYVNPAKQKKDCPHAKIFASEEQIMFTEFKDWSSEARFCSVMFHELAHSTGKEGRLNRPAIMIPGLDHHTEVRVTEEIIAELAAVGLMGGYKLDTEETREESFKYIQTNLSNIPLEKREEVMAHATEQAKLATAYIVDNWLKHEELEKLAAVA